MMLSHLQYDKHIRNIKAIRYIKLRKRQKNNSRTKKLKKIYWNSVSIWHTHKHSFSWCWRTWKWRIKKKARKDFHKRRYNNNNLNCIITWFYMKGTPSKGKHNKGETHMPCRRCGKRTYHKQKGECASCGYGKSKKINQV